MFDADDLSTLKMGDFGMACILPPNATLSSDHMDKKDIGTVEYDHRLYSLPTLRCRVPRCGLGRRLPRWNRNLRIVRRQRRRCSAPSAVLDTASRQTCGASAQRCTCC